MLAAKRHRKVKPGAAASILLGTQKHNVSNNMLYTMHYCSGSWEGSETLSKVNPRLDMQFLAWSTSPLQSRNILPERSRWVPSNLLFSFPTALKDLPYVFPGIPVLGVR